MAEIRGRSLGYFPLGVTMLFWENCTLRNRVSHNLEELLRGIGSGSVLYNCFSAKDKKRSYQLPLFSPFPGFGIAATPYAYVVATGDRFSASSWVGI